LDLIEAEIEKCEVVCCNCHRRRTYLRRGVDRTVESTVTIPNWKIRRNVAWIYEYLSRARCTDCGLADPLVLEFDHVSGKRRNVTAMAWTGYGIKSIEAEVAKCEVRCANCHRRKTSAERNTFRHRRGALVDGPAKLDEQGL
jgi:hypothetical protein